MTLPSANAIFDHWFGTSDTSVVRGPTVATTTVVPAGTFLPGAIDCPVTRRAVLITNSGVRVFFLRSSSR